MNTISNQALFDRVAKHLLTQNERAYEDGYGCKYRTDTGLRCAVGCLIDDEHYVAGLEGQSISNHSPSYTDRVLKAVESSLNTTLTKENVSLLIETQNIHDNFPASNWLFQLECLAFDSDINSDVLKAYA